MDLVRYSSRQGPTDPRRSSTVFLTRRPLLPVTDPAIYPDAILYEACLQAEALIQVVNSCRGFARELLDIFRRTKSIVLL